MSCEAGNIINSPMNVYWRIEGKWQMDFTGLTGADVKGKYILLYSAKDATEYYLWGDDSVVVDPAPAGKTAIPFTVTGDSDSASTLAAAAAAALDGNADFSSTSSGAVTTWEAAAVGEATDPSDVDMGVVITVCRKGKDFDLGLLSGDLEPSFSPSTFQVQAHQYGTTTLNLLNQGIDTLEVTTVMQETTRSNMKELYKIWGGVVQGGTSEVFGVGSGAIGKNMFSEAARLIFQPVTTVSSELSYDVNFMLALPVPDTLTFSGTDPRILSVTWQGFPNLDVNSAVDAMLFGTSEQTGI
jgi:hypothetical protein